MSQFYHARRPIGLALGRATSLVGIYLLAVVYISLAPRANFHQFNYVSTIRVKIAGETRSGQHKFSNLATASQRFLDHSLGNSDHKQVCPSCPNLKTPTLMRSRKGRSFDG